MTTPRTGLASALVLLVAAGAGCTRLGSVDPERSTLQAAPATAAADGTSAIRLTVTARDATGAVLAGRRTSLRLAGVGTLVAGASLTATNGTAGASATSLATGTAVVTAVVDGVTLRQQATIAFVAGPPSLGPEGRSSLAVSATSAAADGVAAIGVTATILDLQGHPVAGATVAFQASGEGGQPQPAEARTGADGVARSALASTAGGERTVTATVGGAAVGTPLQVAFVAHRLACAPQAIVLSPGTTTTVTCTLERPPGLAGTVALAGLALPAHLAAEPFAASLPASPAGPVEVAVGIGATAEAPASGGDTVRIAATAGLAVAEAGVSVTFAAPAPRIRTVYLVPSDVAVDPDALRGMERAQRHLQIWLAGALGSGRTINLAFPVVEVRHSAHDAAWFSTNPSHPDRAMWFWINTITDAAASFYDPDNVWNIYVPVQNPPDQPTGGGGGVTVLPVGDVQGVAGQLGPVCRWTGGLGHEEGHALGLPHPPGCDAGQAGCDTWSLMWFGYTTYPDTWLTAGDLATLGSSPFLLDRPVTSRRFDCAAIDSY